MRYTLRVDRKLLRESIETHTRFSFARSGGKGGQNVNKVNTKARAVISIERLEGLSERETALLRSRLKRRINAEGELFVDAEDERTQERNRAAALSRLENLAASGAKLRPRRAKTSPTRASIERRLKAKKLRSLAKRLRERL